MINKVKHIKPREPVKVEENEEPEEVDLTTLSKKELVKIAEEKEIDIKDLNKTEIIAAIEEKEEEKEEEEEEEEKEEEA